jgi:hypothetical protein
MKRCSSCSPQTKSRSTAKLGKTSLLPNAITEVIRPLARPYVCGWGAGRALRQSGPERRCHRLCGFRPSFAAHRKSSRVDDYEGMLENRRSRPGWTRAATRAPGLGPSAGECQNGADLFLRSC